MLSWDEYNYEKKIFYKAMEAETMFSYTAMGDFPLSVDEKIINENAVVIQMDIQFFSQYQAKSRQRWGYDPFRISNSPSRIHHTNSGMPIKKNSILKEVFDPQLWAMRSGGLELFYLQNRYIKEAPLGERLEPIDMRHLLIGVGIFLVGLLISGLAFLHELCGNHVLEAEAH